MIIKERKNLVIKKIGGHHGGFVRIYLGKADIGMRINGCLLVDFINAFDRYSRHSKYPDRVENPDAVFRSRHGLLFLPWPALELALATRSKRLRFQQTISPNVLTEGWRFADYAATRYCGYPHH